MRRKKVIKVGKVTIGGASPVVIKGMIKSCLDDERKVIKEAKDLEREGCQIIRVAVEKEKDAKIIDILRSRINIPLEADIHFDYRLALLSIERGVDSLRLNPLNIQKRTYVKEVARYALENRVPIRIGVNSGGFKKKMTDNALARGMVSKILSYVKIMEEQGLRKIMVSAKANSPAVTLLANRLLYEKLDYPIHLGLTATGPFQEGLIKSSLTLGTLLYEGIGNALRVSLNSDSLEEVRAAKIILQSLGLRSFFPEIISCPTCSRCKVNLKELVEDFKEFIYSNRFNNKNMRIALMGCPVNGPGEASCADVGIAFGKGFGVLFKEGKIVKRVPQGQCLDILKDCIKGQMKPKLMERSKHKLSG